MVTNLLGSLGINVLEALSFQQNFWNEKSRIQWHYQGDRNTAFFHHVAKLKNATKQMSMLRNDWRLFDDPVDIENIVVDYFADLYATTNYCAGNDLISKVMPALVSNEDNIALTYVPTMRR